MTTPRLEEFVVEARIETEVLFNRPVTLSGVTSEVVSEVVFRSWNIAWFESGESGCSTGRDAAEMKGTKKASGTVKSIVENFPSFDAQKNPRERCACGIRTFARLYEDALRKAHVWLKRTS